MNPPAQGRRTRLWTVFGTLVYVDAASGALRHGAAEHSPRNLALAGDGDALASTPGVCLVHEAAEGPRPIVSTSGGLCASGDPGSSGPTRFEVVPLDNGGVGLFAGGFYLCAAIGGEVTHSRPQCGPWEHFRAAIALEALPPGDTLTIFPGPVTARYHLGCGPNIVPGFLNIDAADDVPAGQVFADFRGLRGAYFTSYDLRRGIPGCDNSLEVIYHSHFLEHLAFVEAIGLLRQARCRLKPGGTMRLLVPDLALWIENYRRDNTEFFAAYRRAALGDDAKLYRTKGAIFMGMMHNFGHRCGYDMETLEYVLRDAGFENIRRTGFRQGDMPDLLAAEPDWPLRAMESLCIECEKPA